MRSKKEQATLHVPNLTAVVEHKIGTITTRYTEAIHVRNRRDHSLPQGTPRSQISDSVALLLRHIRGDTLLPLRPEACLPPFLEMSQLDLMVRDAQVPRHPIIPQHVSQRRPFVLVRPAHDLRLARLLATCHSSYRFALGTRGRRLALAIFL